MSNVPPPYPDPAALNPNISPGGQVVADAPCRKCGYNLRGLAVAGRCPECGTPVGLSVMGDLLRFSDPQWVRTLQRGVRLILWGIVAAIFGVVAVAIVAMVVPVLRPVLPLISIVAGLLSVVGAWLLTEPDPSGIGEDKYGTARQIIRIALVVGVISNALNWVQQTVTLPPAATLMLTIIGGLAGLIGLVGQFAQLNYISKLAMRIPDTALSGRARFLMWAIGISYGVMLVFGMLAGIAAYLSRGGKPSGAAVGLLAGGGCIAVIALIALLVFGIMYLLMLEKLGKRFGEQADAAERTWAGAAATPPPA